MLLVQSQVGQLLVTSSVSVLNYALGFTVTHCACLGWPASTWYCTIILNETYTQATAQAQAEPSQAKA